MQEAAINQKARVAPGRLLVLAALLSVLWWCWALLRPRVGLLSPEADATWTLGARLLFWVTPSAVYLIRSYGRRWSEPLGLRFPYGPRQIIRAIVLPAVLTIFLVLGTSVHLGRGPVEVTWQLFRGMRPHLSAPILEELVFRGVILSEAVTWARESAPNFQSLLGRFWSVQVGTAVLFTSVHWPYWIAEYGARGALGPSISVFVTAIVLGFVFAQTRSLYACIWLHFVNNELSALS